MMLTWKKGETKFVGILSNLRSLHCSMYKFITFGGIRDQQMMNVWKCSIPLKVKIFIWMAAHDIIQSGVQLKKKKCLA